jgi:hypothetical protein
MKEKGIKIQITLPKELADLVEKEIEETHTTKTTWFIKITKEYFDEKNIRDRKKKIIDLKIR